MVRPRRSYYFLCFQTNIYSSKTIKYQLSKNFLSNIYVTFIHPTFEYASEVWDNITIYDSERLEKFQLEAGRVDTELLYSSRASIYEKLYS